MGCFWGAERKFWEAPGVYTTAVGYAGGYTLNPTYREVCSGMTGHTEVVLVVFDPRQTSYDTMLKIFWENHDPTQGMRQGNDVGTQHRSASISFFPEQRAAESTRAAFQDRLTAAGTAGSRRRSRRRRRFITPRTITSSTAKNPGGYWAASADGRHLPRGMTA
jgi:peptide-methionine (S)-S-oxide reductase